MLPGESLPAVFSAQLERFSERIAVSSGNRHLTYGELDQWSDKLAAALQWQGVGPDIIIGLCVDRSVEMIVGMLGILKAGGAYLPIDPSYPPSRIEYLLRDGEVSIVVAVSGIGAALKNFRGTVLAIDKCAAPGSAAGTSTRRKIQSEHLAYVIYTSGSTGEPKGVLIEHRNVVRLFNQTHDLFDFSEQDVWTCFHSISFDFSVWEIWGALLYGGRLVIVPSESVRNPFLFLELLRREQVTILNQTPSAFYQLTVAEAAHGSGSQPLALRKVIFGGERLNLSRLQDWTNRYGCAHPDLINMYGITETTVHATYRQLCAADFTHMERSPIGVPIADMDTRLLNEAGEPAKVGEPGRLLVGGEGLARGYHNRPELTRAKFITIPGSANRFYDSGDCATRTNEGELYFLGRADDQIKIRGFRIEPREIEICLTGHSQVAEAVVVYQERNDEDGQVAAYVTVNCGTDGGPACDAEIISQLKERVTLALPSYMAPAEYIIVDALPLTPHGKVDRDKLRQRGCCAPLARSGERGAPADCDAVVENIVSEILRRRLSRTTDMFDQGITSLSFVRILSRINQHFGLALNGSELGDEATIARLCECISANASLISS